MKLLLNIDSAFKETKVMIEGPELDDNVQELIDFIHGMKKEFLVGRKGDMQYILKPSEIHYFHTENEQVIAVTKTDSYRLREKLYELEATLPSSKFIRLSKSVIANLYELSRFEASFNGTLCVYFKSGAKEYVSRYLCPCYKGSIEIK
ncbi:LytTR family DNA-binding domain-containing protein [Bacillus sp. SA1-12]|uniref:LytTR family DNA-binding domain-containing protein n=1 Tax=Bacillus sp. SA1-12 TaxID=1455638 RepID=UPI000B321C86